MALIRFILGFVFAFFALSVLRLLVRGVSRDRAPRPRAEGGGSAVRLVRCSVCGTAVPEATARALPSGDGAWVCDSAECRRRAQAS